jgi:hypothetical protein
MVRIGGMADADMAESVDHTLVSKDAASGDTIL